jgi:hypothetical protein
MVYLCKYTYQKMKKLSDLKIGLHSKFGIGGIALCGICCALPLISGILGFSSIVALGYYLDKIGIAMIILAAIIFLYSYLKKRQNKRRIAPSCEVKDCCASSPKL